jgi:hypothetical protein
MPAHSNKQLKNRRANNASAIKTQIIEKHLIPNNTTSTRNNASM